MNASDLLTKKQIFLSRLVLGIAAAVLGLFLLLCGADIIKISILKILLPSVCVAAALICFCWAFIQDNTLTLWLAPLLVVVALVSVLASFTSAKYVNLYPLYLLAPALSSVATCLYSKKWRDHLKYILFFAVSTTIFALHGFFGLSLAITIPIFIIFCGIAIAAYTITHNKK